MKPRTMMVMVIAVGCGLGAAILASRLLSKPNPNVRVVVPTTEIARWTLLKNEDFVRKSFEEIEMPKSELPAGINACQSVSQLLGRVKDHVTAAKLERGKPFSIDEIVNRNRSGLASQLSENHTGFAVQVTAHTSAGGWIQPGNHVKVLGTKKMPSGDKISEILMSNIRVAAVDLAADKDQAAGKVPTTITLEVTDEEAKKLKEAQDDAPLSLALVPHANIDRMNAQLEAKFGAREQKLAELEKQIAGVEKDGAEASRLAQLQATLEAETKALASDKQAFLHEKRKGEGDTVRPTQKTLAELLRPGYTAYAVKTSADSSTGGLILPGNRVKVIGMQQAPRDNKKVPTLLMKNIRVIAVDDLTSLEGGVTNIVAKTITLEVTDEEAKKLLEAQAVAPLALGVIGREDLARGDEELDQDRKGEVLLLAPPAEPRKAERKQEPQQNPRHRLAIVTSSSSTLHEQDARGILQPYGQGGRAPAAQPEYEVRPAAQVTPAEEP